MRKLTIFLTLWCLLSMETATAQQGKLRRVRQHMELAQYDQAIELCRKILGRKDNYEAKVFLAKAYRKTHQYDRAERWFAEVVATPNCAPVYFYYYGLTLLQNGNCIEADTIFAQYLDQRPRDPRADVLRKSCHYRRQLRTRHQNDYQLHHLRLNSPGNDFGGAFYQNGLVFASDRHKGNKLRGEPFLDLYFAEPVAAAMDSLDPLAPVPFSETLNSRWHEAMAAFNPDQSVVYLTRNRKVTNRSRGRSVSPLEVVYARKLDEGQWSELQGLPFNSDYYSVAHPSLTPDGKGLFFSSDMPGGFGGTDIYFSRWNNGHWSWPENLGAVVNTEGDELFPFHAAEGRLYFASDGHLGLGGLDNYAIDWTDGKAVDGLVNLGFPINTEADDFGVIYDRERNIGLLTSNRAGGQGGDDLYGFRKVNAAVRIQLVDVRSGEQLENGRVTYNCAGTSVRDLGAGRWRLEMSIGSCCAFSFSGPGYATQTVELCADASFSNDRLPVRVEMVPQPSILLGGEVLSAFDRRPLAGAVVSILGPDGNLVRRVTSNEKGRFESRLPVDCCYGVHVELDDYRTWQRPEPFCANSTATGEIQKMDVLLHPARVNTPDGPKEDPLAGFVPDYRFLRGDSVQIYLLNVHYELDRTSVRREDYPELLKLLELLREYPAISIEISSYTDSRGDSIYNWQLSHRRVDKIVSWLIKQGIAAERLVGRGYGEDRLLNRCDDGIECTEAEHQVNRRTEFRIIDKM